MSYRQRSEWIEDAKMRVLQNTRRTDEAARELIFLYDEAAYNVEKEINALFARFARDNALTDAQASQLLSGREYSTWRKSIEKYMAEASGAAKDSKAMLELNTLAMKSRISQKERLLANIYQSMIDLAGDSNARLETLLGDMLKVNYYESCFAIQRGIGMGFNVARLDEKLIRQVLAHPWSGRVGSLRPPGGAGQARDYPGLHPGQQRPKDGQGHRRCNGQGPLQRRAPGADRM